MRFWMDLAWLLERFEVDFGSKLGGKLGPSWHQNPKKKGTKMMSKKVMQKVHPAHPESREIGGWGSLIGQSPNTLTTLWQQDSRGHQTLPSGTRSGGGY